MKQFFSITCILLFFNFLTLAQSENIILKGKVIDQETNEGIAFISIGIEGTFLGTATNLDGFFELKVPAEYQSKNLFFSAIGYTNQSFSISDLIRKKDLVISLVPQSYHIEEVDVAAESKVLQRILRTASEKIPKNYISVPMNLKMFVEERSSVNEAPSVIQKYIVDIYDSKGYSKPSWIDAFKSRSYQITESLPTLVDALFRDAGNSLDEILEMDLVRLSNTILNPKLLNGFITKMEEKTVFNGDSVWIISYESRKLDLPHTGSFYPTSYRGKIYISTSDYAVLRNEINLSEYKSNAQGRSLAVKSDPNIKIQMNIKTGYKKVNGKYTLAFIDTEKHYTSAENQSIYESGKAVILAVETKNIRKIESRDYVAQVKSNESFWQKFVVPMN